MPDSIINCAHAGKADVVLLGAPYDKTSSYGKGARGGPAAIVECLDEQIEFYERISGLIPAEHLRIAYRCVEELKDLPPQEMVEHLRGAYQEHQEKFRIILGGEHSVSNAAFSYFASRARDISIVQIDAHADLRDNDADYNDKPWGKYAHCSVMRRAHELGFELIQVGVRAYSAEEAKLFKRPGIHVFEWSGEPPEIREIIAAVPTDQVYLTIDVDGIDPSFMPASGTPVQGGLSWYYTLDLIKQLCAAKRLIGADIVEVAPRAGDRRTEYGAAQLCYTIIGCWLLGGRK